MFTGIIKNHGEVEDIIKGNKGDLTLLLKFDEVDRIKIKDYISCNGIGASVGEIKGNILTLHLTKDRIDNSTAKFWNKGQIVNIDLGIKLGEKIGGHKLHGNVESIGTITTMKKVTQGYAVDIKIENPDILPYMHKGGYVAIDGISLTVKGKVNDVVNLSLSSFTKENTSFNNYHIGNKVNIESDYETKVIVDTVREQLHLFEGEWLQSA